MKTYAEKLKDPRWQKKRLEVFSRDNWTCQLCSDKEDTLNVHHLKYSTNPWDSDNSDLITYCEYCHLVIELNNKHEEPYEILKSIKFKTEGGEIVLVAGMLPQKMIQLFEISSKSIRIISFFSESAFNRLIAFFNG